MDELIPLIVNKDVQLEEYCWCYTHQKQRRRGPKPDAARAILNLLLLGSPCVVPSLGLATLVSTFNLQ